MDEQKSMMTMAYYGPWHTVTIFVVSFLFVLGVPDGFEVEQRQGYMLMASDGVWDFLSCEEVSSLVPWLQR